MPEVSGAKLASLTGKSWRTVKKRLDAAGVLPLRQERNADLFDSAAALQTVYTDGEVASLDAARERARRDKEMADKLALENEVRRGELLDAEQSYRDFGTFAADCRSRLIQIPDALGQFCDAKYAPLIVAEARKRIYEALAELAELSAVDDGAAAVGDGEPVGGLEPEAVERGERRAGPVAN